MIPLMNDILKHKNTITLLLNEPASIKTDIFHDGSVFNHFISYLHLIQDVQYFLLVYFYGFEKSKEDKNCPKDILNQVNKIRIDKNISYICSFLSINITAVLEELLIKLDQYLKANSKIYSEKYNRIVFSYPKISLKPTSKNDMIWFDFIVTLFEIKYDTAIKECIMSMFQYRTYAAHEDINSRPKIDFEIIELQPKKGTEEKKSQCFLDLQVAFYINNDI